MHGRRLGADRGPDRPAHRAPGTRADQRHDRDHRGGQEPDAAAGAGGRRGRPGGHLQFPDRRGRAGRRGRRGAGTAALHRLGRGRHGPGLPDGHAAAPHRSPGHAAGRAGGRVRPAAATGQPGARAGSPGGRRGRRAGRAAGHGPAAGLRGRPRGPHRPGPRRPGAAGRGLRRAAGHLGGGQRAVPGQSLGPGRERRVRLPAGRRADHRGRPDRGLGLLAEHVDDAAWQPDRPGHHRGPGGRRPSRDRRAPPGAPRCAGRRGRDGAGRAQRARRPVRQRARLPHRRGARTGSRGRSPGGRCRTTTRPAAAGSTRAR